MKNQMNGSVTQFSNLRNWDVVLPLCFIWMVASALQDCLNFDFKEVTGVNMDCGAEKLLCLQVRHTAKLYIDIYLIFIPINNMINIGIYNFFFLENELGKNWTKSWQLILLNFSNALKSINKTREKFGILRYLVSAVTCHS